MTKGILSFFLVAGLLAGKAYLRIQAIQSSQQRSEISGHYDFSDTTQFEKAPTTFQPVPQAKPVSL